MAINDAQNDNSDQAQDMSAQQDYAEVTRLRPTVGDELRMHREQAGHTIADLAEALRIQKRYLEAVEDSRIEDLPGTVYALGFLRTYAEFYGLDGDAYVTRFKEETEGQRRDQKYILPEPIEEARVPTAAIVLVGVVLAVGAIVAWYSFRPQEADIAGAVPEPPTHLAATAENAPAEPAPASPKANGAAAQGDAPANTVPTEAPPLAPAAPVEAPAVAQPQAEQDPPPVVVQTPPSAPAPVEAAPAAPETVAVMAPEAAAPEAPVAAPEDSGPHIPQVYGAPASARIVITAAEDSWIEIADEEGNRLLSRTLRLGDTYYVPNRSGLTLVTGNAGGLSITVDGIAAPAIGDVGIVRKNVKLDPELLKQGRAWP